MATFPDPTFHWVTSFHCFTPMDSLPRPLSAARETQYTTNYRLVGKDRTNPPHCLFKYTLQGEGAISINGVEHRTPKGTGFLCQVTDPAVVYYYPPDQQEPWEFVWLAFVGDMAFRVTEELVARFGPVFALPSWHDVIRRLCDLERYHNGSVELYLSEGTTLVMDLLMALLHASETGSAEPQEDSMIRDAVRLIGMDVTLNVTGLARKLGVSREHLTRLFHKALQQTPQEYLMRNRLLHACRLLKTSRLPIAEVARDCGYEDFPSFTRFFRRSMRCTPGDFRKHGILPVI